ncbi:LysR family transcriptional regulator [Roseovarius sp.]|uniref:LysR family transcriptional regulator n=1 Tax=Roseovarius sp. TaxID=1486281 RepID=UPI003BA9417A
MDMITAMQVLNEVARSGSFVAASRKLSMSAASVSRIVADLEADLSVRLINRTTRQLNLTDAGEEFVLRSSSLLEEVEELRDAIKDRHDTPHGRLRISCVTGFGNDCLSPVLPVFLERFPDLQVELELENRKVDLLEDHVDVAIRVGPLPSSSLISVHIATQKILFVATPAFCQRYGTPKTLEDLEGLPSAMQVSGEWGKTHHFRLGEDRISFDVPRNVTMSSTVATKNAVMSDYGYSLLSDFSVARELEDGRLIRLLPDYEPVEQPVYALFAHRRYVPRKVRAFIDFLKAEFRQPQGRGKSPR